MAKLSGRAEHHASQAGSWSSALVIATALGWGNVASIAIAVVLAFFFCYALTLRPLVPGGVRIQVGLTISPSHEQPDLAAERSPRRRAVTSEPV